VITVFVKTESMAVKEVNAPVPVTSIFFDFGKLSSITKWDVEFFLTLAISVGNSTSSCTLLF